MSDVHTTPEASFEEPTPTERPNPPAPPWLAEALSDWKKLKGDIAIDPLAGEIPANLNQELFEFPQSVAKWGFRVSEAIREFQLATMYADDCEAAAEEKARTVLGPLKRGTVTNADYSRAARYDPEWRAAQLKKIHAEARVGRLKSAAAALAAKREALLSIGANLRQEMQVDPTLRDSSTRR